MPSSTTYKIQKESLQPLWLNVINGNHRYLLTSICQSIYPTVDSRSWKCLFSPGLLYLSLV